MKMEEFSLCLEKTYELILKNISGSARMDSLDTVRRSIFPFLLRNRGGVQNIVFMFELAVST